MWASLMKQNSVWDSNADEIGLLNGVNALPHRKGAASSWYGYWGRNARRAGVRA